MANFITHKTLAADLLRKHPSRLARLKRRNVISGDAKDLWKVEPGNWRDLPRPG